MEAMSVHLSADKTVDNRGCDHITHRTRRRIRLNPGYDDRTLGPVDDAELLERVADNDRRALEVLYERHGGWLLIRLERRCGDTELADLALQDTFLSVWKGAAKWRGDGEVAAWMWGIAVRRLIDQLRKAGRRPTTTPIEAHTRVDSAAPVVDQHLTPEQAVVDSSLSGELSSALVDLPPDLLAVIIATSVDGLTNNEAANLLGIPVGTLKTRARKARSILHDAIPEESTLRENRR